MAHGHGHAHAHRATDLAQPELGRSRRALSWAFGLTASFMVVEALVGWWSGSLALLADAGHMLADAGALALALAAQRWAGRGPGRATTYGFRRAEVLAAFVNGAVLAVVAVFVVKEAVQRWVHPTSIRGEGMLVAACVGLLVNLAVAVILARSHEGSVNVRAALAHVLSDAAGSVAAILAAVAVLAFSWNRADPILSALIAMLVAYSGWRILRETVLILLEAAPESLDVAEIAGTIRSAPGVATLHDLHVWRVSDGFDVVTVHVVVQRGHHGVDVCANVSEALLERHGLSHVTVQPEAPQPVSLVPLRLNRAEPVHEL